MEFLKQIVDQRRFTTDGRIITILNTLYTMEFCCDFASKIIN